MNKTSADAVSHCCKLLTLRLQNKAVRRNGLKRSVKEYWWFPHFQFIRTLIFRWLRMTSSKFSRIVSRPRSIYQFSNMAPRLSDQNRIFFEILFCLSLFPKWDLDTKKTLPNREVCSESNWSLLEYCYSEHSLFLFRQFWKRDGVISKLS